MFNTSTTKREMFWRGGDGGRGSWSSVLEGSGWTGRRKEDVTETVWTVSVWEVWTDRKRGEEIHGGSERRQEVSRCERRGGRGSEEWMEAADWLRPPLKGRAQRRGS